MSVFKPILVLTVAIALHACSSATPGIVATTSSGFGTATNPTARPTATRRPFPVATVQLPMEAADTLAPTKSPTSIATSSATSISTGQLAAEWGLLGPLRDVILTAAEVKAIDAMAVEGGPLSEGVDKASELGDACLLDCAKTVYTTEQGMLTIILVRAGNGEKAARTSASLREDYLKGAITEYMFGELPNMPQNAWVIAHRGRDSYFVNSVLGIPVGPVVILIALRQQMCFDGDEGLRCEGDLYSPSWQVVDFANAQIERLLEAGDAR